MSIRDTLLAARGQTPCKVTVFLDSVERETKIEYLEALAETRVSADALAKHMSVNHEDSPGSTSIKKHRRGECRCDD